MNIRDSLHKVEIIVQFITATTHRTQKNTVGIWNGKKTTNIIPTTLHSIYYFTFT
jgi:hypothetical protein